MTTKSELSVKTEIRGKVAIVRVTGKLVIGETSIFSAHLEDQLSRGVKRFIVDLVGCTYMDSGGIGELIRVHNDIMRLGGFDVLVLNSAMRELLELVKICDVMVPAYDSEAEALGYLARQPADPRT